jgi:cytochrome c oxidase subunit II
MIANLGWLMFALATGVTVLVLALVGWALWRGRHERPHDEPPAVSPRLLIVGGGVVLPVLVIGLLWVLSLQQMAALAGPSRPLDLEIDVTGRQFSYDVQYPAAGVTLVDEIRIPVGEPVLLRLHSEDVIHSFWVPRLGGKMDLVPGQVNQMWLEASQPGTYQGRCAEFCGIGHTDMSIVVIALEPDEFEEWLVAAAAEARP